MSIKQVGKVFQKQISASTPGRKLSKTLMLLALADYASEDGTNVYPEMARLGWKIGCSERYANELVRELRDQDKALIPTARFASGTYRYTLKLDVYPDKPIYTKPDRENWLPGAHLGAEAQKALVAQKRRNRGSSSEGTGDQSVKEPGFL